MKATLTNLSPKSRRTVIDVTVPRELGNSLGEESTFLTSDNRRFRAGKVKSVGVKTLFKIFATMNGYESIEGQFVNQKHKSSNEGYHWHQWTSDNIFGLIIYVGVGNDLNSMSWSGHPHEINLLESSKFHQKWFVKSVIAGGLIFEYVLTINHNDPVVDIKGKIVWSDRNDTSPNKNFPAIAVRCGEYISIDFANRYGCSQMIQIDGQWISILAKDIWFKDGSAIPFTGKMLTFVGPSVGLVLNKDSIGDLSNQDTLDFESLMAALYGGCVGASHDWDGHWCSSKNIPRRSNMQNLYSESENSWNQFVDIMNVSAGYYVDRPVGIKKNPSITGDQEDFAATKGTFVVTAHDPRHIIRYQYSVYADLFRGFMHYERSGIPINLNDHPNWVTWSGITHSHHSVSPDRLGKNDSGLSIPVNGYFGYDDEHRSQNNLAAYILLTDDWLAEDIVNHLITTDMASYRMKYPNYGHGAARAQGRTIGAWANFAVMFEGVTLTKIIQLIGARWSSMISNPLFTSFNPVKVLAYHNPDGRKPIMNSAGDLLPTWCIWEHSLAAIGFYNAYKSTSDMDGYQLLKTLFEQIVTYGCFKDDEGWWIVNDMWWNNGSVIPGMLNRSNQFILYGRGGVSLWTVAAILAASEFLPNGQLRDKAKECAQQFTNGVEATTNFDAEWWATVRSVI